MVVVVNGGVDFGARELVLVPYTGLRPLEGHSHVRLARSIFLPLRCVTGQTTSTSNKPLGYPSHANFLTDYSGATLMLPTSDAQPAIAEGSDGTKYLATACDVPAFRWRRPSHALEWVHGDRCL